MNGLYVAYPFVFTCFLLCSPLHPRPSYLFPVLINGFTLVCTWKEERERRKIAKRIKREKKISTPFEEFCFLSLCFLFIITAFYVLFVSYSPAPIIPFCVSCFFPVFTFSSCSFLSTSSFLSTPTNPVMQVCYLDCPSAISLMHSQYKIFILISLTFVWDIIRDVRLLMIPIIYFYLFGIVRRAWYLS